MSTSSKWIPLIDYSNKHKISISTLRRRIKLESINFKLEGGKYFISDEPVERSTKGRKSSYSAFEEGFVESPVENNPTYISEKATERVTEKPAEKIKSEPVFSAANKLLDELKKAYMMILQEKEEQIRMLREEISDLRTLVRVLETENNRK